MIFHQQLIICSSPLAENLVFDNTQRCTGVGWDELHFTQNLGEASRLPCPPTHGDIVSRYVWTDLSAAAYQFSAIAYGVLRAVSSQIFTEYSTQPATINVRRGTPTEYGHLHTPSKHILTRLILRTYLLTCLHLTSSTVQQ